jgi:hypothetical protein
VAQYKVESGLLDGFAVGDIVSESDFAEGTNVDALVEGGFLSATSKPKSVLADKPQAEVAKD